MRHTVRVVCFLASCITLSIACYDLYKNFPLLRNFLDTYFKETHEWIETIFRDNVAAFMSTCLYVAWPLTYVYETLRASDLFVYMLNTSVYPFVYLF